MTGFGFGGFCGGFETGFGWGGGGATTFGGILGGAWGLLEDEEDIPQDKFAVFAAWFSSSTLFLYVSSFWIEDWFFDAPFASFNSKLTFSILSYSLWNFKVKTPGCKEYCFFSILERITSAIFNTLSNCLKTLFFCWKATKVIFPDSYFSLE